jgi:hypothetical protein
VHLCDLHVYTLDMLQVFAAVCCAPAGCPMAMWLSCLI